MLFTSKLRPNFTANAGFTLIELLVGLSIAGVILMIALPNMSSFLVSTRIDNGVLALQRLILSARNAAISSEISVTVCPLTSASACSNNWQNEVSVFIDNDSDTVYEPADGDRLIQTRATINSEDSIQTTVSSLTYNAIGNLTAAANITFSYCPSDVTIPPRAVTVTSTGRPHISKDTNSDGIDETRAGNNVVCN